MMEFVALTMSFIGNNKTFYSFDKEGGLEGFVYYKFFSTLDKNDQKNIDKFAIACTRTCVYAFDKRYIGTLRNTDLACMCSSSNCSKADRTNISNYSSYSVSYIGVTKAYVDREFLLDFDYKDPKSDIFGGEGNSSYYTSPDPKTMFQFL